ncbi:hypothetical protein UA08_05916 [Talaromyces atroroseus]|uniref:Uncharacterized protein n=1 Tax=Talaromyces atroroseus TaxID=1441469 RepID=A0A225AXF7_TALAT|nr:hypothetical protein UA08_05916 [Talaromyces atroroseus]OKL59145.1 hypothetical protein UA08_05916 [Talaromyces atroroseus]
MFLTLSRVILASLPSRVLNILVSPGGDGNLLSQVDDTLLTNGIHVELTFSSFALISSQLLISGLVRYLLGHVVPTLLIVEIARADGTISGHNTRPELTFRSIHKAIHRIYLTQSLYAFSRAIVMAVFYHVALYVIGVCLEIAIFRHQLLRPLSYACSSVILSKFRLIWTGATISAHRLGSSPSTEDANQRKWIHLAVPNFIYGLCKGLMYEAQDLIQASLTSSEDIPLSASRRAGGEILAVIVVLLFRFLGLLPAFITLISTEASLLSGSLETLIPSPIKQRGSTIAELLGPGRKTPPLPPGLATFSSALKAFGVSQFFWLLELHLKKCFVQLAIELLTLPLILLVVS